MPIIDIYCDGAVSGNGKDGAIGGYAYIVVQDGIVLEENGDNERETTNQRMELKALIASFKKCCELGADAQFSSNSYTIFSDSAYCVNCIKQKWWANWMANGWKTSKKANVANRDLWETLIPYLSNPNIKVEKVKGHTGNNDFNSIVDKLAVSYKLAAT